MCNMPDGVSFFAFGLVFHLLYIWLHSLYGVCALGNLGENLFIPISLWYVFLWYIDGDWEVRWLVGCGFKWRLIRGKPFLNGCDYYTVICYVAAKLYERIEMTYSSNSMIMFMCFQLSKKMINTFFSHASPFSRHQQTTKKPIFPIPSLFSMPLLTTSPHTKRDHLSSPENSQTHDQEYSSSRSTAQKNAQSINSVGFRHTQNRHPVRQHNT